MTEHPSDAPSSQVPTLRGERLTLRAPTASDAGDRLRAGRHAEFVRLCGGDTRDLQPLTAAEAAAWYRRLAAEPLGWAIALDGRCIGSARLHSLVAHDRRARYAIGLFAPESWGRGYGSEATRLVLGHAFGPLGLHRVDLRVLASNRRAIACYEKCGFRREGLERESALVDGAWQDDVIMSILEHEWRSA